MKLIVASLLTSIILLLNTNISAQDRTIEINTSGNFRPVGSQGILFTDNAVISKPVIKVENSVNNNMIVSIPYKPAEIQNGALATAILVGPDGEIVFGDVKTVISSNSAKSYLNIPVCSNELKVSAGLSQQMGLLESLAAIRSARREAYQLRLKKAFSSEFAEKLRRLEKGFGLQYSSELSDNLNSFELVDRLSRLHNAVTNYQANKK